MRWVFVSFPHHGILPMNIFPSVFSIDITLEFVGLAWNRLRIDSVIDSTHQVKCVNSAGTELCHKPCSSRCDFSVRRCQMLHLVILARDSVVAYLPVLQAEM